MATPVDSGCPYASVFMRLAPSSPPRLSAEEKEYVKKLVSIMPLDTILTDEKVEKECKDLGQEIFDKVKAACDSFAAEAVVKKICNATYFNQSDDRRNACLRKQYIEHVWDGIGDARWRWMR